MARMTFKAGEDYVLRLSRLASGAGGIAKKAIYEGAGIVVEEIKKNLRDVVSDEATGDLEESLGIAPMDQDMDGTWNTKIGFDGYDRKGAPNVLKARVLESGNSTHKKRPFVRPAVKKVKFKAESTMNRIIIEEIEKIAKK